MSANAFPHAPGSTAYPQAIVASPYPPPPGANTSHQAAGPTAYPQAVGPTAYPQAVGPAAYPQNVGAVNVMNLAPPKMHELIRSDRRMFSASDDTAMVKQIQATHSPDGREVDVKPILQIIEDILHHANPNVNAALHGAQHGEMDALEYRAGSAGFDVMLEALSYIINKIACEMSCKCSGGVDAHTTTMVLFNTLSSYSWDAKVVIALAAFSVTYGKFWLVTHLCTANPLAKSIALLMQLPELLEHSHSLKPQFDALNKLVKAILDVTKCIVQFKELPSQYISHEPSSPLSVAMAHMPTAAYWTIRSIVACTSQISNLIGSRHEYAASTTEAWELSSLAHKVENIDDLLVKQLMLCNQHIEEKRQVESYHILVRLFETIHIDNMKILKALLCSKDDPQALVEGTTKTRHSIEVLRRKIVLLLISDLDIPQEEIMIIDLMHKESRARPEFQYEVVWIPIVDSPHNEANQRKFEELRSIMPWYTVHHPSQIDPAVKKYIKEVWHFSKKAILVSLSPQGRVECHNAIHMLWIWGNIAFPFSNERQELLWKSETWRLELIVDGIDPTVLDWVAEGKYTCLYGGEDLEWIKKFTSTAKAVAKAADITLEMVYVGKSNAKERVRKNIAAISADNLSHYWPDLTSIWFFWARLESMLYSKLQHGKSVERDHVMQEVMTTLSFDGSDVGWAIICKGSAEIARGKAETVLTSLLKYAEWEEEARKIGFVPALNGHLLLLHTPQHCNRLILPGINGYVPESVVCSECGRTMEKYLMYRCCTE